MVKITINDNVSKLKQKSKAKNTQDKYEIVIKFFFYFML